jgi:hypothetical protein
VSQGVLDLPMPHMGPKVMRGGGLLAPVERSPFAAHNPPPKKPPTKEQLEAAEKRRQEKLTRAFVRDAQPEDFFDRRLALG